MDVLDTEIPASTSSQTAPSSGPAASVGGDTSADDPSPGSGETWAPSDYQVSDATGPLGPEELRDLDASWRAAHYLSVGPIYLMDNPMLREPLRAEHVSGACWATGARRRG